MSVQEPPIEVVHLFPLLEKELLSLLQSLDSEDWQKPTLAKKWQVRDIAAHLLDTSLRALSVADGYFGDPPGLIHSYEDLVDYLNQLNADWVKAMRRLSPKELVSLQQSASERFCALMASMPLFEPAVFPVSWAGEETSLNWFHIAREYTERWHHQMQIRDAVGEPGLLMDRELFYPCIATFMYGLPYALKDIKPLEGTAIELIITGDAGGRWMVTYQNGQWKLADKPANTNFDAVVELSPTAAWKLFTKGITPAEAKAVASFKGDENLSLAVLNMVAVMA